MENKTHRAKSIKTKGFTSKAKDLTSETKVKDMSCPRGASRPRSWDSWPRWLHLYLFALPWIFNRRINQSRKTAETFYTRVARYRVGPMRCYVRACDGSSDERTKIYADMTSTEAVRACTLQTNMKPNYRPWNTIAATRVPSCQRVVVIVVVISLGLLIKIE